MLVEQIFRMFYLQKYASDDIDLHTTHRCLTFLHLLSLQKVAQNSGTRWQKKSQPATAKFFPQRLIKTCAIPRKNRGTGNTAKS